MAKEKIKVYTYTRVSTAMQIDGYSLDAQKSRMKAFAEFNDYEIAHEYEDAGKSGKSIEGRTQFNQMMEDIKTGKDGVSFVLVFKLSRFGRNAADVLSTLQVMQDFGVNLICVEDGIDSSKDAGKLMISVLSAVAEIERENIRVQTMEGRIQKAREGKWNGGFAPYGYKLVDGKLEINEEEAPAIRTIYEQYVTTDSGANGIAKYLENHGISKVQRQNGKNPLFDARLIRMILKNPVYCGKIAYGRRKTEKVHGTRNEYRLVEQENFLLVDGLHEAIIPEDVWQAAQVKLAAQAKRYEHVNKGKNECTHLLSGIVKCPVCGVGMYGNKCVKRKADGSKYKDFYYYGCKHRSMIRGHKCDYKKQIREELLDDAVAEVMDQGLRPCHLGNIHTAPQDGGRILSTPPWYAYLRIAEGCDNHCAYCVIPSLRGKYRSRPMEDLLEEARELADQGVKELILVAQETTLYGKDLYGEKKLPELLRRLSSIPGIQWIRLQYCYPEEITDELIETIKNEEKVCHYLDIPIQHASDAILKRMGRRTSNKEIRELVAKLRREIPDIALRTTFISGFPGETEEDHETLMEFVDDMEFDRLGVFAYSPEEDTPAYSFKDQVPDEVKEDRRAEIMELQQDIAFEKSESMKGNVLEVMIEGKVADENAYVGRTYMDSPGVDGLIFVNTGLSLMSGDFVRVRVTGALEYDLIGEVEDEFTE